MKYLLCLLSVVFSASLPAVDFSQIGTVTGERPKEPVCEPWPDCWDVRADPDKYREEQSNKPSDDSVEGISTAEIMNASTNFSCMSWRVIGGCVWYTWPSKISFSIKVKHYIPDYVISVYQRSGENPWQLMKWIDEPGNSLLETISGYSPGSGSVNSNGRANKSTNIAFKNAMAVGNPLASVWQSLGFGYFLCKSDATSFLPAYASSFDNLLWRVQPVEAMLYMPSQLIGQQHKIAPSNSDFLSKWAYLYPRTGFVVTNDDLKAAAVAAQRVASIVTSQGSDATMHIANRPSMQGQKGWWPPKTVTENDASQGYFQMLLPKKESTCHLIADMGDGYMSGEGDGLMDWRNRQGNYAWNFWRLYRCCRRSGSSLVMHFGE
ncbi:TPA: TIGR03756 family integrating conjugative element protein [Vibrio cholerae]|nr:TIGR03756 family integrating conjugative element protein [Vibrio cholerae]